MIHILHYFCPYFASMLLVLYLIRVEHLFDLLYFWYHGSTSTCFRFSAWLLQKCLLVSGLLSGYSLACFRNTAGSSGHNDLRLQNCYWDLKVEKVSFWHEKRVKFWTPRLWLHYPAFTTTTERELGLVSFWLWMPACCMSAGIDALDRNTYDL